MKLKEIVNAIEYELAQGSLETEITGIAFDTRRLLPGDLFVAVTGLGEDRHQYVEEAIKKGAAAVLAQRPVACSVPVLIVKNTRRAMALCAAAFYGHPAKQMKIVGVTGTNGKTTVTHLIKQVLDLQGYKTGLIGTNHHLIGTEELPSDNTTPEAVDLHKMFARMAQEGCSHVIMEVSSHSLALDRVYGIDFEVGVFTNLTQDHLDFHKTMEAYAEAKAILFGQAKHCVLNADSAACGAMQKAAVGSYMTYGIEQVADDMAVNIKYSERGVIFEVNHGGELLPIRVNIPGRFSVYNALAAIGACRALGIADEDIQKGLVLARGVKGRAEVLPLRTDFTVMIDYAHTPDGVENILNTVNGFKCGRVIIVFGCGGNRQRDKRPQMGAIAARLADYCVVTSDNPRKEEPEAIIADILEGMRGYEDQYTVLPNRKDAIAYALHMAEPGDIVLLAGKGHETYQVLADGKIHFDEREVVNEIINAAEPQ